MAEADRLGEKGAGGLKGMHGWKMGVKKLKGQEAVVSKAVYGVEDFGSG